MAPVLRVTKAIVLFMGFGCAPNRGALACAMGLAEGGRSPGPEVHPPSGCSSPPGGGNASGAEGGFGSDGAACAGRTQATAQITVFGQNVCLKAVLALRAQRGAWNRLFHATSGLQDGGACMHASTHSQPRSGREVGSRGHSRRPRFLVPKQIKGTVPHWMAHCTCTDRIMGGSSEKGKLLLVLIVLLLAAAKTGSNVLGLGPGQQGRQLWVRLCSTSEVGRQRCADKVDMIGVSQGPCTAAPHRKKA
jgi:hypothetical protein